MDEYLAQLIFRYLNKTYRIHPTGEYPYLYGDKDMCIIYYLHLEEEVSGVFGITVHQSAEYLDKWMVSSGIDEDYPNKVHHFSTGITAELENMLVEEITRTIDRQIIENLFSLGDAEEIALSAASETLGISPEELSGEDE